MYEHAKSSDYHKSAIARQMLMIYNKCLDERTRAKQAGLAVEQLIKRVQKIRTEEFVRKISKIHTIFNQLEKLIF